jgi:hypothetical protein
MAEFKTPPSQLPLSQPEVGTRPPAYESASPASSPLRPLAQNADPRSGAVDRWLHRVTVLLFVFLCAVIGVLLVILPWRPEWTDNHFLAMDPALRSIMSSPFVRGLVSGLGALDVWIGFWEAIHYHEN